MPLRRYPPASPLYTNDKNHLSTIISIAEVAPLTDRLNDRERRELAVVTVVSFAAVKGELHVGALVGAAAAEHEGAVDVFDAAPRAVRRPARVGGPVQRRETLTPKTGDLQA